MAQNQKEAGAYYRFPMWRFGEVIEVAEDEQLDYFQALDAGEAFVQSLGPRDSGKAAERYLDDRIAELQRIADSHGFELMRRPSKSSRIREALGPAVKLIQNRIRVYYQHVPVVSFPSFALACGSVLWLCGEVITVCGKPAKSKTWLNALLVQCDGKPTRTNPLTSRKLTQLRRSFEDFRSGAMSTLRDYYRQVINVDVREAVGGFDEISEFGTFRNIEIAVVSGDNGLRPVFDLIERQGLSSGLQDESLSTNARTVSDFRSWIHDGFAPISDSSQGTLGKPKMLNLFHREEWPDEALPDFDSLRAIILPRLFSTHRTLCYGALVEDPYSLDIPPSALAARVLAKQVGRSY